MHHLMAHLPLLHSNTGENIEDRLAYPSGQYHGVSVDIPAHNRRSESLLVLHGDLSALIVAAPQLLECEIFDGKEWPFDGFGLGFWRSLEASHECGGGHHVDRD